jgi:predicted nucleic acid-binding protein
MVSNPSRLRDKPVAVLDNSAALAMAMPDEQTDPRSMQMLEAAQNYQFVVPALWRYEFANSLSMGLKRKRITHMQLPIVFADVAQFCIHVDEAEQAPIRLLEIADKHGLTAYDAAYLELALRLNAKLVTNDKQLAVAAKHSGIDLL